MTEPIEKITDETVIGVIPDCYETNTGRMVDEDIYLSELFPDYRTLLLEAEANAKKAKAWDELGIEVKDVLSKTKEDSVLKKVFLDIEKAMSELMKEKP